MSINRRNILTSLDSEMRKYGNSDFLCSMASQYSYERQLFSTDVYGTPKEYDFEGHKFFGPQKAEEYLSQLYGKDYMQLPLWIRDVQNLLYMLVIKEKRKYNEESNWLHNWRL